MLISMFKLSKRTKEAKNTHLSIEPSQYLNTSKKIRKYQI